VARALEAANPGYAFRVVPIRTRGDDPGRGPIGGAGIKGLFVKEIEDALLAGEVDLAVHSAKDLPSELPDGLGLCAAPERASPFDALVLRGGGDLAGLRRGARVGTSSLRRAAQLRAFRPDFEIVPLRGNVDTRLGKVGSGEMDATLLGASGLMRLKGPSFAVATVDPALMLPAPGQGQLGLEIREGDVRTREICSHLDHPPSALALVCERAFMEGLGAGCQTPAACWARFEGPDMVADALVCELDGSRVVRASGRVSGASAPAGTRGVRGHGGAGGDSGRGGAPDGGGRGDPGPLPDPAEARALGLELASGLLAQGGDLMIARAEGRL
jgi:hydroxymethylbilane synthase